MKASLSLLVLVVFLLAGCACPSPKQEPAPPPSPTPPGPQPPPSVTTEDVERLTERFSPIIHLKGEGEVKENFEPEQIEIMVDEAFLRDVEDPLFSEKATLSSLVQWSKSIYYLDLVGLGPETHSFTEYQLTYDKLKDNYRPTVYARVLGDGGYTIVQYWIFYYFNDWRNFHEGDWELVQLCFPGYTVEELLEMEAEPIFAAYSQHQTGQRMSWDDMKANGLVQETHPKVYVAQGSHANYFSPGQFWSGLDFDDTGLSSWRVIGPDELEVVMLHPVEAESERPEWLKFKGHWGEYLDFSISVMGLTFWQQGPFGPPWSDDEHPNVRWGNPAQWAAGLPEYPEPFWTSFFELAGDWFNQAFFSLFSPADLHIYDSSGRHVGLDEQGEIETEIPGAIYVKPEGAQYKIIIIPNADISQNYNVVINGTDSGTIEMKAQVPDAENNVKHYLEYANVPVSAQTLAKVSIRPPRIPLPRVMMPEVESVSVRDTATKLELDSDGDGTLEFESLPGDFERQKVSPSLIEAKIDIEPDVIDLGDITAERFITVYIELPREYNPKSIDVGSVRLMKIIAALEKPIEVLDYDQDGIYELMVKFDRKQVIEYLLENKLIGEKVVLKLACLVEGRRFEGVDTINIFIGPLGQPKND